MYEVLLYETGNGKCPVREFLLALNPKILAKVLRTIDLLEVNGPELGMPHSRLLQDGIHELRVKQSNNITRILYFFCTGGKIVLTSGFVKKTQKTPRGELKKAILYRNDFM